MKKLSLVLVFFFMMFQAQAAGSGNSRNNTAYISAGLEMMKYTFDKYYVSPDYYTSGLGFALGYRWESFATEFKYASHSGEETSDSIDGPSVSAKSSLEDTIYGVGFQWHFLYILHLRAGYNFYKLTGKGSAIATVDGTTVSASDEKTTKSSGVFYGGGLNIPIFSGSDLYADYVQYIAKGGKVNSFELGYRFYF